MKRTVAARIAGAVLLAAGLAGTSTAPVQAAEQISVAPEMLQAMQRDLGLTPDQAIRRMTSETRAAELEQNLRGVLNGTFGGAYFDAVTSQLVVGVTDAGKIGTVQASGAKAVTVSRSEQQLDAVKSRLDEQVAQAPKTLTGWYVDVVKNTVVVTAKPGAANDARSYVTATGTEAGAVQVVESTEQPRPLYDVRGGDAYYIGSSRCSIGFSVKGGFVTAGHCAALTSGSLAGSNRVALGSWGGYSFPGNDYAYARTNSSWTPRGVVNRYNGSTVAVSGHTESAVGASICRSGSTTGWHCGTVQAKNQTVTYSEGMVSGLTRTNVCAEPGDSGGSWLSGSQAQGVTSGGSGDCSSGGTTYFQPVNEILSRYGLTLVTS
ncbi:MAG TPA: S1 family peptidase [Amycolatopsis sp.]|uniref:S1 family peptidase n=1 Tax=Amycolatopsis sp. TaxID=37632 RepID=UPI002B473F21|nr:S1 family peptidase [Amycolatopsis sp.]HKS49211.1 S1 family peptidase [Amycolatopsis sp.]